MPMIEGVYCNQKYCPFYDCNERADRLTPEEREHVLEINRGVTCDRLAKYRIAVANGELPYGYGLKVDKE